MTRNLRQQAYEHIRRKLQLGELTSGSRLEEPALAKEIGVSRAPVREAIRQLESEGLVSQVPRSGAFVKVPDRHDIRQWCELREALECFAVEKAAVEASAERVARIVEAHRHMLRLARHIRAHRITDLSRKTDSGKAWTEADIAFHMSIMAATDNRHTTRLLNNLHIVKMFIDDPVEPASLEVSRVCRGHGRIVRAIRRRDGDQARRVMKDHIVYVQRALIQEYENRSLRANCWADLRVYSDGPP